MIFGETKRLRLRSFEESDIPDLVHLLNNWEIVKWMGLIPMPYTKTDAREWLEKMTAIEKTGQPQFFFLCERETDKLAGAIGIHPIHSASGKNGDYEMGYWLGEDFWNQGLMTEAGRFAVAWALEQPWVQRLTAVTDIENKKSQRILEKLGFVFQKILPRIEGRGSNEITFWIYPQP